MAVTGLCFVQKLVSWYN